MWLTPFFFFWPIKFRNTDGEAQDSRQRPPSPNTLEPRKLKVRETTAQFDEHDGRPLTAACSEFANTEPSILWSPPRTCRLNSSLTFETPPILTSDPHARTAVEAALPVDFYNHKFDRMDPELARALRDSVTSDAPSWGVESAEEPEVYSPVSAVSSSEFAHQ